MLYALFVLFLITNSTASISTIPNGNAIHADCTNPATIYVTKLTAATVTAYGNCVDTWFTWLLCAPADAMIVVSEIGEQWSPQTAPAIQAEIEIIISFGSFANA